MTQNSVADRLSRVSQNVRFAWRSIARRPIGSMGLVALAGFGIASATLVATAASSRVFRAEPVANASRLFVVWDALSASCAPECADALRAIDVDAWRTFSGVDRARYGSAWRIESRVMDDSKRTIQIAAVDSAFFDVARPVLKMGRALTSGGPVTRTEFAAVVSYRYWRNALGARSDIIGQTMRTAMGSFIVVGVASASFDFPSSTDLWVPSNVVQHTPALTERALNVVVRLGDGADASNFARTLALRSAHRSDAQSEFTDRHVAVAIPFGTQAAGADNGLWLVIGVVCLVFAAALINVAVLCTMRALPKLRENGIRAALGASRRQLLRPHVYEGFLLTLLASALAVAVMLASRQPVEGIIASRLGSAVDLTLDARFVLFATAAAIVVGMVMTVIPAMLTLRAPSDGALRSGGYTSSGGSSLKLAREGAIVVQLFLSYCLTMSAAAFGLSYMSSQRVSLGFDARHIALGEVRMDSSTTSETDRIGSPFASMRTSLAQVAQQRGDALWMQTYPRAPLKRAGQRVFVEGRDALSLRELPQTAYYVNPSYYDVFKVQFKQGRDDEIRNANEQAIVVVNSTAATFWWPGENAIGKRVRLVEETFETPWLTVVAVVQDQNTSDLSLRLGANEIKLPMVYAPLNLATGSTLRIASRFTGSPERAAINLAQILHKLLPTTAAVTVTPRFYDRLLRAGGFDRALANARVLAVSAVLIVVVGLLGIAAGVMQIVQMQQRELAVRIALGAPVARVVAHVVVRIVLLAAIGVVGGTTVMMSISGMLAPFMVTLRGPGTMPHVILAAALFAVCVVVALMATTRIGKIDLVRALRVE